MRRAWLGLALCLVFILSACSSNSPEIETQAGSWQVVGSISSSLGNNEPPMHRMVLNSLGNPGYAFYTSYASFSAFDGTNWAGTGIASGSLGMSSIRGVDTVFDSLDRPVLAYTQWVNGVGALSM